ncbi:MAG: EamA family transporter [Desulfobacterales bacterium]|nr:EamA family transporter [Desulfobacterales bacterium]MCP4163113.1 EamA family transporter [Deltaproteobacteria bacterium]
MYTGYLYIISAACFWGLIGIFSSIAFSEGMEPLEVGFWRASIAWVCFAIHAFVKKDTHIERKDIPLFVIFGIFGVSIFYISYLIAVKTGGAAFASVLLYSAPAWVIFISLFFYKEKLTIIKLTAVVLIFLGVFLISRTGGNNSVSIGWIAILSGLTSGFCYSLYYTMGKYFSKKYSSTNLFLYVLPIGVLGILPFVDFTHKTPLAWCSLVSVAVLSTFIANYCYYQGLKHLEAGRASIVATLEPIIAAITAYIFLGEYFTPMGYLGTFLILIAVVATIYES